MQSSDFQGFSEFVRRNFHKGNSVKIKDHCKNLCKLLKDNLNCINLSESLHDFIQNEKHNINSDEMIKQLVFPEDIDNIEKFLNGLSEIQLSQVFHLWYPLNDQVWEEFTERLCNHLSNQEEY